MKRRLQASQQFARPSYAEFPENGRVIRWQISLATAPTAVNIPLPTAINDVDALYAMPTGATNMNSTLIGGQLGGHWCARKLCASQDGLDYWLVGCDGTNPGLKADVRLRNSMFLPFSACAMVRFHR
jgi:hypothetical protein